MCLENSKTFRWVKCCIILRKILKYFWHVSILNAVTFRAMNDSSTKAEGELLLPACSFCISCLFFISWFVSAFAELNRTKCFRSLCLTIDLLECQPFSLCDRLLAKKPSTSQAMGAHVLNPQLSGDRNRKISMSSSPAWYTKSFRMFSHREKPCLKQNEAKQNTKVQRLFWIK